MSEKEKTGVEMGGSGRSTMGWGTVSSDELKFLESEKKKFGKKRLPAAGLDGIDAYLTMKLAEEGVYTATDLEKWLGKLENREKMGRLLVESGAKWKTADLSYFDKYLPDATVSLTAKRERLDKMEKVRQENLMKKKLSIGEDAEKFMPVDGPKGGTYYTLTEKEKERVSASTREDLRKKALISTVDNIAATKGGLKAGSVLPLLTESEKERVAAEYYKEPRGDIEEIAKKTIMSRPEGFRP